MEEDDNPFGGLDSDIGNVPETATLPASKDKFKFKEYHKIEHSKAKKGVDVAAKHEWVVLEKVHGANFSFYCDGSELKCSRRSSLLSDHETFFNFQIVREKYRNSVFSLFNKLQNGELDYISVYGEIFGGFYPHPDVLDLGMCPVQKEIYYSDKVDFYAFDVRLHFRGAEEKIEWLNYDKAMELFKECRFFYAEPLLRGTLEECMAFSYKMNTTIPAKFNLPPLDQNQCEGVVVKSVEPVISKKGRAIFKLKNPKFQEVNPRHESIHDQTKAKKQTTLTTVYNDLELYINQNRLISLKSKIGPLGEDRLDHISNLLLADIMADYTSEYAETWEIVKEHHERISTNTKSKISTFVLQWINDGNS